MLSVAGFLTGPSRLFNLFDVVLVVNSKLGTKLALHGTVGSSPPIFFAPSSQWGMGRLGTFDYAGLQPAYAKMCFSLGMRALPSHRIVELTLADSAPNGLNLSWP